MTPLTPRKAKTMLSELVTRIEAATEGSRELDALIFEHLNPQFTPEMRGMYYGEVTGEYFVPDEQPPHGFLITKAAAFTTSVDAALALIERVLPGWTLADLSQQDDKSWFAELREGHRSSYGGVAMTNLRQRPPTPALALVLVALRALQANQTGGVVVKPRHSIVRPKEVEYAFWLIFEEAGNLRLTRAEPSLDRAERAVACVATLPRSLWCTPTLRASITVAEGAPAAFQLDVEAVSEAIKAVVGVDIDLKVGADHA